MRRIAANARLNAGEPVGEIVIDTHAGKGWFDPTSEAKGDVFGLSEHFEGWGFPEALERASELLGFVPSQPVRNKPLRDEISFSVTTPWNSRPRIKPDGDVTSI